MRHHTTNPSERAADIATKEADRIWKEGMEKIMLRSFMYSHYEFSPNPYDPLYDYELIWLDIYHTAFKEMAGDPGGLYETNDSKHISTCH
jgi:hypothetical protein